MRRLAWSFAVCIYYNVFCCFFVLFCFLFFFCCCCFFFFCFFCCFFLYVFLSYDVAYLVLCFIPFCSGVSVRLSFKAKHFISGETTLCWTSFISILRESCVFTCFVTHCICNNSAVPKNSGCHMTVAIRYFIPTTMKTYKFLNEPLRPSNLASLQGRWIHYHYVMGHNILYCIMMRNAGKCPYTICGQRRSRSACASVLSDLSILLHILKYSLIQ